jgi:transcriptional regulator with XRE-family HTH domain
MKIELEILGENLRRIRHSRGVSQEALGGICALHRTYICDIERGARNVSFESLLKIASGLETTISELTRGVETTARLRLRSSNAASPASAGTTPTPMRQIHFRHQPQQL